MELGEEGGREGGEGEVEQGVGLFSGGVRHEVFCVETSGDEGVFRGEGLGHAQKLLRGTVFHIKNLRNSQGQDQNCL